MSWTTLPAGGRVGPPPPWPLVGQTERERARWQIEWARPQAIIWETTGQCDQVALYVRAFVDAEQAGAPVVLRQFVVAQARTLGLTLDGLLRNRWTIGPPDVRSERVAQPPRSASAKRRFRVVTSRG